MQTIERDDKFCSLALNTGARLHRDAFLAREELYCRTLSSAVREDCGRVFPAERDLVQVHAILAQIAIGRREAALEALDGLIHDQAFWLRNRGLIGDCYGSTVESNVLLLFATNALNRLNEVSALSDRLVAWPRNSKGLLLTNHFRQPPTDYPNYSEIVQETRVESQYAMVVALSKAASSLYRDDLDFAAGRLLEDTLSFEKACSLPALQVPRLNHWKALALAERGYDREATQYVLSCLREPYWDDAKRLFVQPAYSEGFPTYPLHTQAEGVIACLAAGMHQFAVDILEDGVFDFHFNKDLGQFEADRTRFARLHHIDVPDAARIIFAIQCTGDPRSLGILMSDHRLPRPKWDR